MMYGKYWSYGAGKYEVQFIAEDFMIKNSYDVLSLLLKSIEVFMDSVIHGLMKKDE